MLHKRYYINLIEYFLGKSELPDKGIIYRKNGKLIDTGRADFIPSLDVIPRPAYHLVPFERYSGFLPRAKTIGRPPKLPYVRMLTSGIFMKVPNFELDTTNIDISSTNKRITINNGTRDLIYLGEVDGGSTYRYVAKKVAIPQSNTVTIDKPINLEPSDKLKVLTYLNEDSTMPEMEAFASILEVS